MTEEQRNLKTREDRDRDRRLAEAYTIIERMVRREWPFYRKLDPAVGADDIIQLAWIKVARYLYEHAKEIDSLQGLIHTIVRYSLADFSRRGHRWRRLHMSMDSIPDHRHPDPAESAATEDLIQHLLHQCSGEMSDLILMWLKGMTSREIADQYCISEATVRQRISRFRRKVYEMVDDLDVFPKDHRTWFEVL